MDDIWWIWKFVKNYFWLAVRFTLDQEPANIHCANMATEYYFVQPQFGYNELEWSKIKMGTPL